METDVTSKDFQELAASRSTTYSFLSSAYISMPTSDSVNKLLKGWPDVNLHPHAMTYAPKDTNEGFQILTKYIEDSRGRSLQELVDEMAVERTRLFRGVKRGYGPPPPYESVYVNLTRRTDPAAEITKLLAEAGAGPSRELNEPVDYIGVELDIMRLLCDRETEAWKLGRADDARNMLYLQRKLLKEHLVAWVPKFCDIALEVAKNDFYKAALKITKGTIIYEKDIIEDLIRTAEDMA